MADTIENIADSLIVDATPATEAPEAETLEADDQTDETDVTTDVDEIDEEEIVSEETDEGTEADDDEVQDGGDGDTYTFKVDGEEVTASVDDLIRAYSIDGAAQKRLQEATEARATAVEEGRAQGMQAAQADIAAREQEVDGVRQQLSQLVGLVGQNLFAPTVERPDPSVQQTDPIGYLQQMEAWRDDQNRIGGLQQQIAQATQQQQSHVQQQRAQRQQTERMALRQKRPDLAEQANSQAFTANVRLAQEHLGFTNQEVDAFPDHRGLLALEMVGKTLAAQAAQGPTPAQRVVKKAKGKPLAPGAVQHTRNVSKKKRVADRNKARQTGSVQDVAKLLVQDAPRQR